MGKPHSMDLRRRVVGHVKSGHSRRSAAERYEVSASFAVKLSQRLARTGSVAPARQGRPAGSGKLARHLKALIAWVEAVPDITMVELAAKLKAERGVKAHSASLARALRLAGFTVKKNAAGIRVRSRRRPSRA